MINRVAPKRLLMYIAAMVMVHCSTYFLVESLSLMHVMHTLLRIVVSGVASILVVWYIVRLFLDKIMR